MTSQGPNSPSTVIDNDSIGSNVWNFPENAKTSDGLFSDSDLSLNGISHYLIASNFGFAIPGTSIINGIVVEILRQEDDNFDNIYDNAVRIVKAGSISTTDKSSLTEWRTNETSYVSYGSSTNLWGETFTPAQINASTFGVALSAKSVNGLLFTEAQVDHIRITVYYTDTGSTTTSTSTTITTSSTSSSTSTSTTTSTSSSTSTTSTSTSTTSTSTSSSSSTSTSTSSSSSTSITSTSTSTSTTSTSTSTTSTSTSTTSTSTSSTTTYYFFGQFKVSATGHA